MKITLNSIFLCLGMFLCINYSVEITCSDQNDQVSRLMADIFKLADERDRILQAAKNDEVLLHENGDIKEKKERTIMYQSQHRDCLCRLGSIVNGESATSERNEKTGLKLSALFDMQAAYQSWQNAQMIAQKRQKEYRSACSNSCIDQYSLAMLRRRADEDLEDAENKEVEFALRRSNFEILFQYT